MSGDIYAEIDRRYIDDQLPESIYFYDKPGLSLAKSLPFHPIAAFDMEDINIVTSLKKCALPVANVKLNGGQAEETLAEHIIDIGFKKPVVGYIAGRRAPKEKRMGHAGAIVMGNYGSAESKITMFAKANIPVAKRPTEVPILLAGKMEKK